MTNTNTNEENLELEQELNEELENIQEETSPELENITDNDEVAKYKEALARSQADYENFKKRVDRDKADMIHFITAKVISRILPQVDNMERIIKNTPAEQQNTAIYEGVVAMEKAIKKELEAMNIKSFDSVGQEVDPDKHEVMTQIPGQVPLIIEEFEKGYMLNDKVLRVAKVVVGAGE